MEMMWNMANTLQIFYYFSYVYVQFPNNVTNFFSYLQYSNAKNDIISYLSYLIIPESKFTRGSVNDRMEDKAFYVSSSDKMPWLIPFIFLFALIKIIDWLTMNLDSRIIRAVKKFFEQFKYNFFIRLWLELYLEISVNATINIYFYDYSTMYEFLSLSLAILFISILLISTWLCSIFLLTKYDKLSDNPDEFKYCSWLFKELNCKKPAAVMFYIIFFLRRALIWIWFVWFYETPEAQISISIATSALVFAYSFKVMPYKSKLLNMFNTFNEIWLLTSSMLLVLFKFIKTDQPESSITDTQNYVGYAFIIIIMIFALGKHRSV